MAACTYVQVYRCGMSAKVPDHPGSEWVDLAACTLPTAERPLRLAECDELFSTSLRAIEWTGETSARLLLAGGPGLAARTQRLADAESYCCSFFTFVVTAVAPGHVVLDVQVPAGYADVLAGLIGRAGDAMRATA